MLLGQAGYLLPRHWPLLLISRNFNHLFSACAIYLAGFPTGPCGSTGVALVLPSTAA